MASGRCLYELCHPLASLLIYRLIPSASGKWCEINMTLPTVFFGVSCVSTLVTCKHKTD